MSYKVKPILKLYKYENSTFIMQAQIDDYSEVSFEHNLYQAGTFTISINYNIPNSQLFQRGLFVQFGNNPGDFGEIYSIQDSISKDGKGSQTRTIVGYDARYILKRRVIKNMNSNGLWVMTAKGELCIRNLIKDQCGVDAEEKRRLPIINNIPDVSGAKGKEYSVSEQFTNLYEVCKTIATQSEIGWRISFINNELNMEIYEGEDLSQTVRFDTNYESLANGKFSDTSESFSNAIYIGGKGQNDSRDIYEGENGSPSGFNRFESWDNQSQMTTEDEYETEAISMLSQYGQTLTITGNGLVKCPYVFREQYNVGDIITVAFSGKSAAAQILSVTEHWSFGNYEINFNFGKPQNNLSDQLQLMLRQIQKASETSNSTESVKWYNVANENTMDSADVTYNTIGFTGAMTSNKTFTFYLDNEKTGAKSYNIYAKNLTGNYNLTLTTGRSGKTNVVLKGGVNITSRILIDEEGNIISQGMTSTSVVESGNNQPVTSDAVANELNDLGNLYKTHAKFSSDSTVTYYKICNYTNYYPFVVRCEGQRVNETISIQELSGSFWQNNRKYAFTKILQPLYAATASAIPRNEYGAYLIVDSNNDIWVAVSSYSTAYITITGPSKISIIGTSGTPSAPYKVDGYGSQNSNDNYPWIFLNSAQGGTIYVTIDYTLQPGDDNDDPFGIEFLSYNGYKYFLNVKIANGYPLFNFDKTTNFPYVNGVAIDTTAKKLYLRLIGWRGLFISMSALIKNIERSTSAPTGVEFNSITLNANPNLPKYIYNVNEQITQNVDKVISLIGKVETKHNYKLVITANYNNIYYFEGLLSVNMTSNNFNVISIARNGFAVTSSNSYELRINYTGATSNYTIAITEC